MRSSLVAEVMGDFYVGGIFRWTPHRDYRYYFHEPTHTDHYDAAGSEQAIVINQRNWCTPLPQHMTSARLYVMLEGKLFRTTAYELYCQCKDLQRLIGCDTCKVTRDECVRRHLKFDVGQLPIPGFGLPVFRDFTSEAFENRRRNQQFCMSDIEDEWAYWKTEIEGHVFIPPSLAAFTAVQPGRQVRHPFSLSFRDDTIEYNRKELSARSKNAAATRRTKQKECTKCYFGGTGYGNTPLPCGSYEPRWCTHGAWEEEQLIDTTLRAFEARLHEASFTMRQFEQMLALGGQTLYLPNSDKTGHWKYVVSGLRFGYTGKRDDRLSAEFQRVAAENRGETKYFNALDDFLRHLPPHLRRIFDEAPSLSRETLAVAAQLTCARALAPYVCTTGCFREVQPGISHLHVSGEYAPVEVGYWVRSYWRSMSISSLEGLCDNRSFKCLPMFDIHKAPKSGVEHFRFTHWPRR
jgi:hypothetical protein